MHYRGATYEPAEVPVEMIQGEVIGQYRGAVLRSQHPRRIAVPQPSLRVKYRGAWAE
ncbi:MAG: DUF4278 domain-containing protein [Leptolyngbyaceae cyanobacterium SM1_4_3]|nr:DUF4278 domain-containing protein [Leptolyngbyaceae cyanobacterium SM1_4_3]